MLHVHRSERTDALVAMLADLVADPLDDPMTPEVVSVPTRGIERWLTQRLSAHLGAPARAGTTACAPTSISRFPGTLVNGALALAAGTDPDADPWLPERAVWPLLEVVEEHFDDPWLAPLAQHIRNSETVAESKRFSSIRHVADLFDRYAVHRPDMLQAWAEGGGGRDDGDGAASPAASSGRSSCGDCCGNGSGDRARPSGSWRPANDCGTSPTCSSSHRGCRCSA